MSRPSLRSAIDFMCKSCIYDSGSGNGAWREQVAGCSSSHCPLHSVRPLPVKASKPALKRQNFVRSMIGAANPADAVLGQGIGSLDGMAQERPAA